MIQVPTTVKLDALLKGDDGRDVTLVLGFFQLSSGNIQVGDIGCVVLQLTNKNARSV